MNFGFNFSFEYYNELMDVSIVDIFHTIEVILFDGQIVPSLVSEGPFKWTWCQESLKIQALLVYFMPQTWKKLFFKDWPTF